ncbi:MAG TPA: hypothetical protein VHV75_19310 [Solirubrobacteraceae bacterium]|jgi:hypothetical protein|nr:hypothetical protein [Solirubrobacteraceae bacterium]
MHTSLQPRGSRSRRRVTSLALALIAALMLPASALAASFKLTPHIANHTPIINKKWPITVDVTKGKTKLSGSVTYQFLFSGSVVSTQKGHSFKNGVYKDSLDFPANALGQALTLRIVVKTKDGTEHIDWTVKAEK